MEIGKVIKALRKEAGLTLDGLFRKTGIATSTLSRIEKGIRTGSVKTHLKICEALGIKLSGLYAGLEEKTKIFPMQANRKDAETVNYNGKAYTVSLARDLSKKKMSPELLVITASQTIREPGDNLGTEKFIFCLEGFLEVVVDKEPCRLKKGGTLYFNSSLPHRFKNIGKTAVKCLSVSSTARI